ncbi:transcription regulator ArsR [Caballeronia turbans]|jgi:DNA-binding transcriptional ArsR family regulator|uniref:ArsR/SmtB family transcription factor n=1 Tax=Caballeronia TaxID=1827195 RepID=UPI00074BBA14|nr:MULTISPECIES: helix-turn-helix domain-containing protein [Caballeronia]SAL53602.1 transcription regulator ArsR [Caballeronia turbans]
MNADLIHKALANPLRRDILAWLKTPEHSFAPNAARFPHGVPSNTIQARSGRSQSTVSAHLALMVEAGLLVSTRVGSFALFSRNEAVIDAFIKHIAEGF